jgi:hypothetical protein
LNGEFFLGITHQVDYDNPSGSFTEQETVVWGTKFFYDTLVSGPFTPGNYVTIGTNGAAGRVLFDDATDELIVALEDPTITILDTDVVTEFPGPGAGATSTTAAVNTGGGATLNNADFGGTGLLLADDTTDTIWIQLLTGNAPVNDIPLRGITSGATADTNGSPVAKTVPKIFTGSYTGTYIGAYGVGIESADLSASDTIQDLLNVTQTPPNNVSFTVSGLVTNEDRVLVGPRSAGILQKDQFFINSGNDMTTGTETSVVIGETIPTDTPATGTGTDTTRLRVQLDTGIYRRQAYSSYTGATFTIPSTDYSGANSAAAVNEVFIAYIDDIPTSPATSLSYTAIYNTDRDLLVRVRDGGGTPIKTFEAPATFGSANTTVAAIRTTDA